MKDWLKNIKVEHALAFVTTILIFIFLFYVAFKFPDAKEMIYGIVGGLIASLNQILQFFFGSSKSSQKKDETIQRAIENNQNQTT